MSYQNTKQTEPQLRVQEPVGFVARDSVKERCRLGISYINFQTDPNYSNISQITYDQIFEKSFCYFLTLNKRQRYTRYDHDALYKPGNISDIYVPCLHFMVLFFSEKQVNLPQAAVKDVCQYLQLLRLNFMPMEGSMTSSWL